MPKKAGFTKKDHNQFKVLRSQGHSARDISSILKICQPNVEAAIAQLEAPAEVKQTPAQKGAATRAKKKADEKAKEKADEVSDEVENDSPFM